MWHFLYIDNKRREATFYQSEAETRKEAGESGKRGGNGRSGKREPEVRREEGSTEKGSNKGRKKEEEGEE